VEEHALQELAATISGVVSLRVLPFESRGPLNSDASEERIQKSRGTP
jgi:hypothetical protein